MSKSAPWIALAIDWQDSEMLDDANHGVRLAWICLLCFAKAQGRAGRVRFRGRKFAENYRLSMESVEAMVERATTAKAITVDGDVVTVVNWKDYQDPRVRSSSPENHRESEASASNGQRFTKTSKNDATTHPPPRTTNHGQKKTPIPPLPEILDRPEFREALESWLEYRGHCYRRLGLVRMISRAERLATAHGVPAVVDAMDKAISNGWKGWDHESSFTRRNPQPSPAKSTDQIAAEVNERLKGYGHIR